MQRLSHQGSRCVGPLKHVASCSFGKDSLATILLALEHGEPLDEAVYCEVMFDKEISGEVPEHRDFIYTTAIPALERRGVKVTVLRSEKTYVDLFTGKITRGPKKGLLRSFPICGRCAVQRDCKLKPILRYQNRCRPTQFSILGSPRTSRNGCFDWPGTGSPYWTSTTAQRKMQSSSASGQGCFRLSTHLQPAGAVGSALTPKEKNCAISITTTQTCGNGCWSYRPYPTR